MKNTKTTASICSTFFMSILLVGCSSLTTSIQTPMKTNATDEQPKEQIHSQTKIPLDNSNGTTPGAIPGTTNGPTIGTTSEPASGGTKTTDGLAIEKNAKINLSKRAVLFGNQNEVTIAEVQLPLTPRKDYEGYLGIFNQDGQIIQRFPIQGYSVTSPVQIAVLDLTGDQKPEIVLELDEHANGGLGLHVVHAYVSENNRYIEAPFADPDWNSRFEVQYDKKNRMWQIQSKQDERTWKVQMSPTIENYLDPNLFATSNLAKVDHVSSIDLQNQVLKTKRLIWFGNLQLNSLAVLVSSYFYQDEKWQVKSYKLEPIDTLTSVTEQN